MFVAPYYQALSSRVWAQEEEKKEENGLSSAREKESYEFWRVLPFWGLNLGRTNKVRISTLLVKSGHNSNYDDGKTV